MLLIIRLLNLQMQNSYLILDEYVSINLRAADLIRLCTRQSRKVICNMIDTLFLALNEAVEPTFVAFLSTRKHTSMASLAILSNSLKNSELTTTHNTFRDCCVHFCRQLFSKQLYLMKKLQQGPSSMY